MVTAAAEQVRFDSLCRCARALSTFADTYKSTTDSNRSQRCTARRSLRPRTRTRSESRRRFFSPDRHQSLEGTGCSQRVSHPSLFPLLTPPSSPSRSLQLHRPQDCRSRSQARCSSADQTFSFTIRRRAWRRAMAGRAHPRWRRHARRCDGRRRGWRRGWTEWRREGQGQGAGG